MHKPTAALIALSFAVCAATELRSQSSEPFGLIKIVAPEDGEIVVEWHKLVTNIAAARGELHRCQAQPDRCDDAERGFVALVKEAAGLQGRARIELVNQRINGEIHYTSDEKQWGTDDVWSLPIDPNRKGSLETGEGDCEDYALAKYMALHQSGVPETDLRMVLVHDAVVDQDHAVLAIRDDGKWLILDNRWNQPKEDKELTSFRPLFIVETSGVSLLAERFRLSDRKFMAPHGARAVHPASGDLPIPVGP
jgi:predicted transglutaminase-like cysteine proteinase